MIVTYGAERVTLMSSIELVSRAATWGYAEQNGDAIATHWKRASAANPNFFNGVVHVIKSISIEGLRVAAEFMPTDFQNFLYWRDQGFPASAGVRDGFGSALIRSSDGQILLGRQRPGNINEGLAYLPGGFIDMRDVRADGTIDIRGSVYRELMEETGLGPETLDLEEGLFLAEAGPHVSFALPFRAKLEAGDLIERIEGFLANQTDPELDGVVAIKSAAEMADVPMPYYARVLLSSPLAWTI